MPPGTHDDMEVKVVHGLAALHSVVHHHPESFVEPLVLSGERVVVWLIHIKVAKFVHKTNESALSRCQTDMFLHRFLAKRSSNPVCWTADIVVCMYIPVGWFEFETADVPK